MDYLKSIAKIRKLFAAADYAVVKTVDSEDDLEGVLVNLLLVNRMAHHAARSAASPPIK